MIKSKRIIEIEELVTRKQVVTIEDICEKFGISSSTARRDVNEIVESPRFTKVYGGLAVINASSNPAPLDHTLDDSLTDKDVISREAASKVKDGDTIYLDSGTTILRMVPYLADKEITIVTYSLPVINEVVKHKKLQVIAVGGMYDPKVSGFIGTITYNALNSLVFDKLFLSVGGLNSSVGYKTHGYQEKELKTLMFYKSVGEKYCLIDHGKFEKDALIAIGPLDSSITLITDQEPPVNTQNVFKQKGIKCIIAQND